MTDEEHDLLQLVYAKARGRVDEWVPLMELPSAAFVLAEKGFITILDDGPDLQHVALTESGRVLAMQLAAK